MSRENVERVRQGFDRFVATGRTDPDIASTVFVWDMSNFDGWPERQTYEGDDEVQGFLEDWTGAWDDWGLELDALLDAGDKVVALVRQRGKSKSSGMPVEMSFAMVWTFRDGRQTRMDMYSDRAEAFEAAGLSE
ncbi:MAG TPA: nuclear transport factor 2 family protein [Solirubrobacterales bacterium]|jgi:ketosteroid isomerase-like protein|nr:nuclear transport factor 2 family protein [Solirubrobacterales bacterium]